MMIQFISQDLTKMYIHWHNSSTGFIKTKIAGGAICNFFIHSCTFHNLALALTKYYFKKKYLFDTSDNNKIKIYQ